MWYDHRKESDLLTASHERATLMINSMRRWYDDIQRAELKFQKRSSSNVFMDVAESVACMEDMDVLHRYKEKFDFNIIRQNCVAAKNQITSSKPKVVFLTDDQPYETIETSEKLGDHVSKIFEDQDIYSKSASAFMNACLMGLGILKLNSYKDIVRLHPKYFFCISPYKGRQIPVEGGNYTYVAPDALIKMFPDKEEQIRYHYMQNNKEIFDVVVYDLYYAEKINIKFCDKILLDVRDWPRDFIPYQFFRWEETTEGVLQRSIPDEIGEAQDTLEVQVRIIEESFERTGIPTLFVQEGTQMADSTITDRVPGSVIEYVGDKPPTVDAPKPISSDYFAFIDKLLVDTANACGNNPTNMAGELPKELNQASGIALQNYSDLDSKKFSDIRSHYEKCFMGLARKILIMGGPGPLAYDPVLKGIKIEEELSKMRLAPASILPDSPAGQVQTVNALIQSGLVDPQEGLAMIKHPDLKKVLSSLSDRVRQIDLLIEKAMREDKMPVLYKELGVAEYLDRARRIFATIQRQKGENYPPLVKLSIFIEDVAAEMQRDQEMVINTMQGGPGPVAGGSVGGQVANPQMQVMQQ